MCTSGLNGREMQSVHVHAEQATRAHCLVRAGSFNKKRSVMQRGRVKSLFAVSHIISASIGQLDNED